MAIPQHPLHSGRDAKGHFTADNWIGNAGGRPLGLAEKVRAATHDGDDLVKFYLAVFKGKLKRFTSTNRIEAGTWLTDRGWGKPIQQIEATQHVDVTEHTLPLEQFTIEELRRLLDMAEKQQAQAESQRNSTKQ